MLVRIAGTAPFLFVVGKGGVGKTTAAAALALGLAEAGEAVHAISTDPAHSLRDVLGDAACSERLALEEFDAAARAEAWTAHAAGPLTELIEAGTYLDGDDVAGLTRLALPGVDELMAVLRLVDLSRTAPRAVVDTAPTGHTLRLLDAAATHASLARALAAMAEKAAVVASSLTGTSVRLRSESFIDELESYVRDFRERVLDRAGFIVAARAGTVVEAETARLNDALGERRLRVVATIWTGPPAERAASTGTACLAAPFLAEPPRGCGALRGWLNALESCDVARPPARPQPPSAPAPATGGAPALPWLRERGLKLWLVAGKGGVGKTTCAAALALALADGADVLLCSADPAGSLGEVLAGAAPERVRTLQIDPAAELARLRDVYRADLLEALERLGLSAAATLDRRVIDALWELAPPGMDEIAALGAMIDAAAADETVVLDTAPTGHFLRLIALPAVALDWVRQLMRMIVKYGASRSGGAAEALLRIARELRALEALIHDSDRTGALVVTLDEPVVAAETRRLHAALRDAGVPLAGTIVNRAGAAPHAQVAGDVAIHAPALDTAPTGLRDLRNFMTLWKIVA